jgi:polysaccharide deacetylase family protein (PEP-CTERM system associated)
MRKHILTIAVEDYFHVAALRGAIRRKHWERLEPRLQANLMDVLALLDRYGARATFFVFGFLADSQPELIRAIVERGHEVASRGYWPRSLQGLLRADFLEDLRRAKEALEAAGSNRIVGYRAPQWLRDEDRFILDVLAEEGYVYDSSVNPILRRFASEPEMFRIHRHRHATADAALWEFPISTVSFAGLRLAISGGNYVRQLPHTLLSRAVAHRSESDADPLVFYFMPWELDRRQPRIQGISTLQRIRHYRNLAKTRWVLDEYLHRYAFHGVADYLGLALERPLPSELRAAPEPVREVAAAGGGHRDEVTLVVPMFNEAQNVSYLRRTLTAFRRELEGSYRVHLVLVDDGSTDDTWPLLSREFADVADCALVQHEKNRGVAAAILTGVRAAPTEIVCSIDCDCSYDPRELSAMIPQVANGSADLVTASPYHPEGHVLNVPEWRLFLSKTLSRMYSTILHDRFYTFTSCCRVYRKSALATLDVKNGGFLGVAETLIGLKLRGGKIIEHPATLESRLLGESKMKIVRTIMSHLSLLGQLTFREGGAAPSTQPPPPTTDSPP